MTDCKDYGFDVRLLALVSRQNAALNSDTQHNVSKIKAESADKMCCLCRCATTIRRVTDITYIY